MKALFIYSKHSGSLELREIEEPVCGEDEIKIEIKACGICGTDLHIKNNQYPWPLDKPLGHEYSGIVVEAGSKVENFEVGDRVASCRFGGFAKYVKKNAKDLVFRIPNGMSFEEGALMEPFSNCVQMIQYELGNLNNLNVLIAGPGVMGMGILQAAKVAGATAFVMGKSSRYRLELAKLVGADYTFYAQQEGIEEFIMDHTSGKGLDMVFECSGSRQAFDFGLKLLKRGGRLCQVGLVYKRFEIQLDDIVRRKIIISGQIGYSRESWLKTIELVSEGIINAKSMVSHRLPLSEWQKGFELCEKREGLKIILVPD